MRKGLVDDLKTHLRSVTKKYLELDKTDMFYKYYHGAVNEGVFGLISTVIVLYENKLITLEEKEDLMKFASDTLDILK